MILLKINFLELMAMCVDLLYNDFKLPQSIPQSSLTEITKTLKSY